MLDDAFGEFGNIICCDDVRLEISKKFIFVGVYADDIVVETFPAHLNLRLYVQYRAPEVGEQRVNFTWSYNGNDLFIMEGGVNQQILTSFVSITLPHAPLDLEKPGDLEVRAVLNSGRSRVIMRKAVSKSEAPIFRV
jgi:hypothetical protein